MASCDPDSFLLSPSAPPHWHSGIISEGARDESEKEKQTEWARQDGEGERVELALIMKKRRSTEKWKYGWRDSSMITPELHTTRKHHARCLRIKDKSE